MMAVRFYLYKYLLVEGFEFQYYNNKLFYMEESLKKLAQFLEQVFKAETQADQYKTIIFQALGGRRKVFMQIDEHHLSQINSDDICAICKSNGMPIYPQTSEIIGRYFRNWNEQISYEEFSQRMKPKNREKKININQQEDVIATFIKLVRVIVKSFNKLQNLRKELALHSEAIIEYFDKINVYNAGLNTQNLKQFMIDTNIYNKKKYDLIADYIFGNSQSQIEWRVFFGIKGSYDTPIRQSFVYELNQQATNPDAYKTNNISVEYKKQNKLQNSGNIKQILGQIEQMQRSLHQKKLRRQTLQIQKPITQQQQNKRTHLVGKIVAKNQPQPQPYQPKIQQKDTNIEFNIPFRYKQSSYPRKSQCQEYFYERPRESQVLRRLRNSASSGTLKKAPSQAQLKIQEIERKAMDKFLSNRRESYFQASHHIPYYYLDKPSNLEFAREFGYDIYQNRRLQKILSPARNKCYPVYSRNKVSKPSYNLSSPYLTRAVSPRLLRY